MPNNLVDLESLRCFERAASLLNFRAAAKSVHLSPPAFGDRLQKIEEELGARLFERTTRTVKLTEAGARLLPHARRLLTEAEKCKEIAAKSDQPVPFELTIGTRFELGLSWLVPSLPRLSQEVPERRLHLYFGDSEELLARLKNHRLDAFVSSARLATPGLEYAALHEEKYVFVASKKLLEKTDFSRAEDARAHVLIDAHPDLPLFRYFLDAAPAKETFSFSRVEYMGTIGAVRERVLQNAGVAVLPFYFVKPDLEARRLRRLFSKIPLAADYFRLIWLSSHPQSQKLRELAESLKKIALR